VNGPMGIDQLEIDYYQTTPNQAEASSTASNTGPVVFCFVFQVGFASGGVAAVCTNPLDVINTRIKAGSLAGESTSMLQVVHR
jgi:hypothetical protein